MHNYYDYDAGDWVTDESRYRAVLAEARFASIRDHEISRLPPELGWDLVLALLHAVPDDTIHHVGAGPLQDLIHYHGPRIIDRIQRHLPTDERLQRALLEVDLARGTLPPSSESRFVAAAGPRFVLLEPTSPDEPGS